MRVDLYTLVHKAQRHHLHKLLSDMGRTDFADDADAARVAGELKHMIAHLKDHARNEETYIHPLYASLGRAAEPLEADHHALEGALEALERLLDQGRFGELYPAYARFLGVYLLHLDAEEKAQTDVLWKHCTDEALAAVFNRFKAERAPALAKEDLAFMLPALSVPELTRMFRGMKASAPAPAFQGACALAAARLEPATWSRVQTALA